MSDVPDFSDLGDCIFNEFRSKDNLKRIRQNRLQRLESRFVKNIIKFYFPDKCHLIIKTLMNDYQQKTGNPGLFFSSFYDRFRDFPVWLGPELVPSLLKDSLSCFLSPKLFSKSGLRRAWERFHDCLPGFVLDLEIPVGFVFDFYHSKAGCGVLWVFHNCSKPNNELVRLRSDSRFFYIQPFSSFLEGLGWRCKA